MTSEKTPFDRTYIEWRGESALGSEEYKTFKMWYDDEVARGRPAEQVVDDISDMLCAKRRAVCGNGW